MLSANRNDRIARAAIAVAACFCLLGIAQVVRPLRWAGAGFSTAFAVQHQQLTRHALQEVGPRSAQPRAPFASGLLPAVPVTQRYVLPRMTVFVPLWPMENWAAHRRVSHASTDTPDPA